MIALPTSPGNVVPVSEVAGQEISQVVIGSSANPGVRDFWVAAAIVEGKSVSNNISFDINPTSRQVIQNLIANKGFENLIAAGARFHQSGCMGCIGMGQAPASGTISLRTMPRNFPSRSGTEDDRVHLCSPETAAASALTGKITDPRDLEQLYGMKYPRYEYPEKEIINTVMLVPPAEDGSQVELQKGPNIKSLPTIEPLMDTYDVPVLLKMGDNVSTDEILRAGAEVLPFRSNLPEISKFSYSVIDPTFYDRAQKAKIDFGGHIVVAKDNYAQGSSREHAALAPKFLGQVAVIANSYARIAWQNLVNFGIVPLEFIDLADYDKIEQGDLVSFVNLREDVQNRKDVRVLVQKEGEDKPQLEFYARHSLSDRQIQILLRGGIINEFKAQLSNEDVNAVDKNTVTGNERQQIK